MNPLDQKLHDTDIACAKVRMEAEKLLTVFKDDLADAECSALVARDLGSKRRERQALSIILRQHIENMTKIQQGLLPVTTTTRTLFPLPESGIAAAIRKTEEQSR